VLECPQRGCTILQTSRIMHTTSSSLKYSTQHLIIPHITWTSSLTLKRLVSKGERLVSVSSLPKLQTITWLTHFITWTTTLLLERWWIVSVIIIWKMILWHCIFSYFRLTLQRGMCGPAWQWKRKRSCFWHSTLETRLCSKITNNEPLIWTELTT